MTVTPDEARELLDGVTPGPWCEASNSPGVVVRKTMFGGTRVAVVNRIGDAHLVAAARDLAETVIAQAEQLKAKDAEIERLKPHDWLEVNTRLGHANKQLMDERATLLTIIDRLEDGHEACRYGDGRWMWMDREGYTDAMTPDVAQFFADRNKEAHD